MLKNKYIKRGFTAIIVYTLFIPISLGILSVISYIVYNRIDEVVSNDEIPQRVYHQISEVSNSSSLPCYLNKTKEEIENARSLKYIERFVGSENSNTHVYEISKGFAYDLSIDKIIIEIKDFNIGIIEVEHILDKKNRIIKINIGIKNSSASISGIISMPNQGDDFIEAINTGNINFKFIDKVSCLAIYQS